MRDIYRTIIASNAGVLFGLSVMAAILDVKDRVRLWRVESATTGVGIRLKEKGEGREGVKISPAP